MRYPSPPIAASAYGLHESLARVEDGGDAFVDALVDVLRSDNVDIRTRCTVSQCADVAEQKSWPIRP